MSPIPATYSMTTGPLDDDRRSDDVVSTIDELLETAAADVARRGVPACHLAVRRDGEVVASAVWLLLADGTLDVLRPVADVADDLVGAPVGGVAVGAAG
jgi:hypothetical protein